MSDDDSRPPFNRPAAHLLNELESIKGVLTDDCAADAELPAEIPLLDDMVIDNLESNAKLLNIEQIFDDDMTANEAPAAAEQPMQFPRFTLDVAISDDSEIAAEIPNTAPVSAPPISTPPVSAPSAPRVRPDYSREVLIQELVDEFIPQIEAELYKRLRQLNDAALHRLKETK